MKIIRSEAPASCVVLGIISFLWLQPRFFKNTGLGSIPNDKIHAGTEGTPRAFFRCVRTPAVLAILHIP